MTRVRCFPYAGQIIQKPLQFFHTSIILTIFGSFLLATYTIKSSGGIWDLIDSRVFYFFNHQLTPDSFFTIFIGIINLRHFDILSFFVMSSLYFFYFQKMNNERKRQMIACGLAMLLSAVIIKQSSFLMPVAHPSPTLYYDDAQRVSKMVAFPTKDSDGNSFPSDHGMMFFIFAAFMGRYFGKKAFAVAVGIAVCFSLPRIMSGAHWFGDIYAGSLGVCYLLLSWVLLTPLSDIGISWLQRLIPPWVFPVAGKG